MHWCFVLFLFIIFSATKLITTSAKKYCLDDQISCVSVSGFWLRVDGVAKSNELVLVNRNLFRRRYASIKFRFLSNTPDIDGREVSLPWGKAIYVPYDWLERNGMKSGLMTVYSKQHRILIDCGTHDCLHDVVKIENSASN